MNRLLSLYKNHNVIINYSFVFCLLLVGLVDYYQGLYLKQVLIFYCVVVGSYIIADKLVPQGHIRINLEVLQRVKYRLQQQPVWLLFTPAIVIILVHYWYIGGIPLSMALDAVDPILVAKIRWSINGGSPIWLNYLSFFVLKAIVPFALVYSIVRKEKTSFWIAFIVVNFYTI